MASMTDLITNIPEIVDFNEFGRIKETISVISPRMFDSYLNEAQNLINKIESLANIVINETPKEPDVEGEVVPVKSLKLCLLRFKNNIITFRRKYVKFISDFAFYSECELLLNQEKLIKNTTCQPEIQSDVFIYTRTLEDSIWNFKSDLESLINCSYSFETSERELIPEINRFRRMINISQIKVVTNRLGYLTIDN
ncbi:DEHA2F11770p [Debaryomyces hansenii CBS767]|uniref:DEHA2F11770p n=1 Tax=Debaryomyces hansenii (strain ATCC 36239 / CBS 767 / BCRC 21394 / JCM 1990 / NBRC 0083 / IGC 2968) TaxID=284592 RepID=Q6BLP6_DEBHA|nr:DEHA2F11770p [Debaryomyces hansenii CBS767]CAG89225.2 DEHA2F11770p [Debaryomyces hansenii CBS767]|eukprot:XP_460875.2 DEHA2F11770p [Debaryomyces hansenii CBS767]